MTITSNTSAEGEPTAPVTIGSLVAASLTRAADSFEASDPVATGRMTPDALHDARVALRRIRSTLRTFRIIFDAGWAASVRSELAWFADLLGAVRQIDIITEHLSSHEKEWSSDESLRDKILEHLAAERAEHLATLANAGSSARYRSTLAHLDTLRVNPPFTSNASTPIRPALRGILRRPWRDLRQTARLAQKTGDEIHLHSMRIRAKELRYASEIASEVLGPSITGVAKAASRIQDRLGDHRDAFFTASYLEELVKKDPEIGYLAGQLFTLERFQANHDLDGLSDDLRRLKRRWQRVRFGHHD